MAYIVQSSEKTRRACAEAETKALLYLMNFCEDCDEIHYFVVDFFNDITGMDRYSRKLWDVQSKSAKNNSAKVIGRELVTLYKNYLSDIEFTQFILFLGGVSKSFRTDPLLNIFDQKNINPKALKSLIQGLREEASLKTYIDSSKISDESIADFLTRVVFVIDNQRPSYYIKAIIKDHPSIIPEEKILEAIFNEIRNEQSSKKNSLVEGVVIQTTDEVLNHCRHLTNSEIRLLTLQRIINRNPVDQSIPHSFVQIYNTWAPEKQKDLFDDCIRSLCLALFNKNAASAFWSLFEQIYGLIVTHKQYSVQEIYNALDANIKEACPDFDALSLKYFIAVVKDGIQRDN